MQHLYSAGTSQINVPVVTDNMTACIAVACDAENVDADTGERMQGAQVRVFHLAPFLSRRPYARRGFSVYSRVSAKCQSTGSDNACRPAWWG